MPGQTLFFLFNFSDRQLHGLYRASSAGQENLSPDAWAHATPSEVSGAEDGQSQGGGSEGSTPFPAQCRFENLTLPLPLPLPLSLPLTPTLTPTPTPTPTRTPTPTPTPTPTLTRRARAARATPGEG